MRLYFRYLYWLVLLVIISFLFLPALKIKFWWLDDGYSISVAQQVISFTRNFDLRGLNTILVDPTGRFRTIYWLYQTLVYIIGGANPQVYFLIHFLTILLTAIFVFEIVKNISKSSLAGLVAGTLYILTPINTENLYRLGPAESLLALFVAISMYYLLKKKIVASILFLFLATFTKETGFVIWLPVLLVYLLQRIIYQIRNRNFEKYCLWGMAFLLPVLAFSLSRKSGYLGNYVLNAKVIGNGLFHFLNSAAKGFFPFSFFLLTTYAIRIVAFLKSRKMRKNGLALINQGMFIALFLVFVLVQLPWKFLLDRYLMPATVGLVIFLGIELAEIIKLLQTYGSGTKRLAIFLFIAYFTMLIIGNSLDIYRQGQRFAFTTNFVQNLYSYLSQKVPPNGIVLLNFLKGDSTIELVYETNLQLALFYNRKDARAEYLDLEHLPDKPFTILGTPMIREQYSREMVEATIENYQKGADLVLADNLLVITDPINLFKQFVKKSIQLVFSKKPFTNDGIYTYYVLKDYWYQYDIR